MQKTNTIVIQIDKTNKKQDFTFFFLLKWNEIKNYINLSFWAIETRLGVAYNKETPADIFITSVQVKQYNSKFIFPLQILNKIQTFQKISHTVDHVFAKVEQCENIQQNTVHNHSFLPQSVYVRHFTCESLENVE